MGLISHVGKNTGCGHYVAHIRKDGRWAIFDGRKVKPGQCSVRCDVAQCEATKGEAKQSNAGCNVIRCNAIQCNAARRRTSSFVECLFFSFHAVCPFFFHVVLC